MYYIIIVISDCGEQNTLQCESQGLGEPVIWTYKFENVCKYILLYYENKH